MMTDLYAALGAERTDPPAVIRRKYRKAAKRVHPDVGGKLEEWKTVATALAVLTDEARRAHYDKTGKIEEPPADDRQAKAMNTAMGAVTHILQTCEQRLIAIEQVDIIKDAVRHVVGQLDQCKCAVVDSEKNADKARKVAGRFKAKRGKTNRLGPMVGQWAAEHERTAAKNRENAEILQAAITILQDHEFKFEPRSW